MATTTASAGLSPREALNRPLGALAMVVVLALAGTAVTAQIPHPTVLTSAAAVGVLLAVGWMLFSERYEWSLAILMLYIGLADGFLKLSTGSSQITLVRDLLLYAIAAGALVRMAVNRTTPSFPPLTGWVVAWVAVVVVQLANPEDGTLLHSLASLRPHLEWIPLFFLGYLTIRSKKRLRAFLVLLLAIAAANGVVGLIQQNMTPAQLSGWGPGYAKALKGESSVSARNFTDEEGVERNRPFALGGDIGFGGAVGYMAIPAALALLGMSLPPGARMLVGLLTIGVVLAVITSAARVQIVAAVVSALAFAALTVTSRGGMRVVLGTAVGLAIGYGAVAFVFSHSEQGAFDRFNTITTPGEAVSTAYAYRAPVLALVPDYATEIPLGAGIGSSGPAGSFAGQQTNRRYNGESEPTFLLIEAGVPGLLVMLGFNLVLIYLSVTRIRRLADREARVLLTAVAAPLFALLVSGLAGITTAAVPGAPYLWFAAGVLSYWLLGPGAPRQWSSA
ncbi:MAG TPA: hypothetical protein VMT37_12335 [Solirubrobacterales bacterium]|nr:hypothetical protein [Solirubrobacterales bacterium]